MDEFDLTLSDFIKIYFKIKINNHLLQSIFKIFIYSFGVKDKTY